MSQKLTRFFDMEELLPQALHHGLPWWLSVRESACQCRRPGFDPWVGKIPWSREWQPTSVFLPGESHGQRSLAGYSPWDRKESDTTEPLHFTSQVALVIKNLPASAGDVGSIPGLGRLPWRRKWQPTLAFFPGKLHGQRSLAVHGARGQT